MNSDERLMALCAKRLTGKDVEVRLRRPTAAHAVGQTYKTKYGVVVDVDPNFSDGDSLLKVFLHECAHVRNDLGWMPQTFDHLAPSGSVKVSTTARNTWRAGKPESSADELAKKWMEYAQKNYRFYEREGYTTFGAKLLCLIAMKRGV